MTLQYRDAISKMRLWETSQKPGFFQQKILRKKKKERWKESLKIKNDLIYKTNNCKVWTLFGSHVKQTVCV